MQPHGTNSDALHGHSPGVLLVTLGELCTQNFLPLDLHGRARFTVSLLEGPLQHITLTSERRDVQVDRLLSDAGMI